VYFDITDGTITGHGTRGFGKFQWRVDLVTDDGNEYRSNGIILDRDPTEDRSVWRWHGPIIEP
jgi:hypothetical protein